MNEPLQAQVVRLGQKSVQIQCPYCTETHQHYLVNRGFREHRPAACHLYYPISPEQRVIGYVFTTRKRVRNA